MSVKNNKTNRPHVNILGVRIDSTPRYELLEIIRAKLLQKNPFYIVTPNPEILLQAQSEPKLSDSLNSAEFSIPDGIGLSFASLFLTGKAVKPIKGRIFMLDLMRLAQEEGLKVYLLGSNKFSNTKAQAVLRKVFPQVSIKGSEGFYLNRQGEPDTKIDIKRQLDTLNEIHSFKPSILFIGFGAPREQLWVAKNMNNLKVRCVMGVGGSFDYLSGVSKLPPEFVSNIGLEWLWRLINEPKRLGRIFNAVILFPLSVMRSKLFTK